MVRAVSGGLAGAHASTRTRRGGAQRRSVGVEREDASSSVISKIRRMWGSTVDDADLAARGAESLDGAQEHAERHRIDECRLGQVDDETGGAAVEGCRDRLAELGRRVEVGLTVHRDVETEPSASIVSTPNSVDSVSLTDSSCHSSASYPP